VRIYTRRGDGGMTSLRAGVRVPKDHALVEANGAIDEAQAALGLARAECGDDPALAALLVSLERDLWIVMAELATPESGSGSAAAAQVVTEAMVDRLEEAIDATMAGLELAGAFAVPGDNRKSAALDFARTVVRRAERLVVGLGRERSLVVAYLNRLSDLCWALARASEAAHLVNRAGEGRTAAPRRRPAPPGGAPLG